MQIPPSPEHSSWLISDEHRKSLRRDAQRQVAFFDASIRPERGFYVLDQSGRPRDTSVQELHTTTRLIHSFSLAKIAGQSGCDALIDQGMRYLRSHHHDADHGGYVWSLDGNNILDDRKLAYGHVFVLLAASSAKLVGHPDADRIIDDVSTVLDTQFWEQEPGLYADEWNRDWSPFSTYRGMNANMHGAEAMLTAYEATGREIYLERAGRILDFFLGRVAPLHDYRLPEHYDSDWNVDKAYSENPMFRPAGTTPGHSFELARLLLQHWDLLGRPDDEAPALARTVMETALDDAWDKNEGGFCYTLDFDGSPAITSRYWWPVTEALGVLAAFIKLENNPQDDEWYRKLWSFAEQHFIDHENGGWFPEIDTAGQPCEIQFIGKPDIYHSLQAVLFPLAGGISNMAASLSEQQPLGTE